MKLLIAEDDPFFRRLLQQVLASEYELSLVEDGSQALETLQSAASPRLAILDLFMPLMSGPQVCRKVRELGVPDRYLMILTAKNSAADILWGLRAGADDYVTKPFDPEELRARVRVGRRVIELQDELKAKEALLGESIERQREMSQLLPICLSCHKVRSDAGYWLEVERYVEQHAASACAGPCPWCTGAEAVASDLIANEVAL
jgi:DNA-binding response OmpR family regulator